jgi:N-acetylneuraminate synthase/N,N'-diacetyllegionaminate synthase
MIERLELSRIAHIELFNYCKDLKIEFLSTPYDIDSAKFLQELGVNYFKTASADIVDLPLHEFIASTKIPTIIATGMATLGEVERVVKIYNDAKSFNVALLHCVSNYPCSHQSINMRSMCTLGAAFDLPVGYSDHSEGYIASVLSIALNAKIIEKHFTSDKTLLGPDQAASSSPDEFTELVEKVRLAEIILGSRKKIPQEEEMGMANVSRKSICLSRSMEAGEIITLSDVSLIRPGTGMQASLMPYILGRKLRKKLPKGCILDLYDLD